MNAKSAPSLQEIFTQTIQHLRAQGERSSTHTVQQMTMKNMLPGQGCKYRLPKGDKTLKCAAGFWIPDSEYYPDLEGVNIVGLQNRIPSLAIWPEANIILLACLQRIHDRHESKDWEEEFEELGCRKGLQVPPVCRKGLFPPVCE